MSEAAVGKEEAKPKEVESTKLGLQIFYDIWSGGGAIGGQIFNMVLSKMKLDEFRAYMIPYLLEGQNLAWLIKDLMVKGKGAEAINKVLDYLKEWENWLMDAYQAGLGMGLGGGFRGVIDTYLGMNRIRNAVKNAIIIHGITPWIDRYYKTQFTPNIPDTATAFRMHMEGLLSRSEFNYYASMDGWGREWHDKLYELLDRDPDIYMAFSMLKRGLITHDTFIQCLKINGFDLKWHDVLEEWLHRIPSFGELMRIADYVELPDIYVREAMRKNGYTEDSINYLAPAIQLRPLREEVRNLTTTYTYNFYRGYISYDTFTHNITRLGLQTKEKELIDEYARARFNQYAMELKCDIIENKVRKKILTTIDEIEEALTTIGMNSYIANLLAQKWYYYYIYGGGG
jgi:hypothetical protein